MDHSAKESVRVNRRKYKNYNWRMMATLQSIFCTTCNLAKLWLALRSCINCIIIGETVQLLATQEFHRIANSPYFFCCMTLFTLPGVSTIHDVSTRCP
jgi:hypothetical protein